MKKMQEPELRVVTYELNDILVTSGGGCTLCYTDTIYCSGNQTCGLNFVNCPSYSGSRSQNDITSWESCGSNCPDYVLG